MGSRKTEKEKERLSAKAKSNKRVPVWVILRTKRKFSENPRRYHWRRSKLGNEIKE